MLRGGRFLWTQCILQFAQKPAERLAYIQEETAYKLVLYNDRKTHAGFRLITQPMTSNDLERVFFVTNSPNAVHFWADYARLTVARAILSATKLYTFNSSFGAIWFIGILAEIAKATDVKWHSVLSWKTWIIAVTFYDWWWNCLFYRALKN